MTTTQRLDSLTTELGGHNLVLGVHLSTLRHAILGNDRHSAVSALTAAFTVQTRIGQCISEMAETTAPASATPPADTPPEPGRQDGSRGGTCANCGEYAAVLVPSIGGRWDYCRECADLEIAEEAPAAPEEDGDDCAYLYRDPDEQLDELRDRRMDERRAS